MGIGLTSRIVPKNAAFLGMVSSNQIIGSNVAGEVSVLPSSCISTNSLSEQYLRVSNSPTNGYYLKYTDADDLTWAEVVGGSDVAWSGAQEFYGVSGLVKIHNLWYTYSSSKLSESGQKLSEWYYYSSSKLSESGAKYTDLYTWYAPSTNKYTNWLSSGEKLSRWFSDSSAKLNSGSGWNRAWASSQIALYEVDNNPSISPFWSSQTTTSEGSIFYDAGPVVIGESGSIYNDYKFQVFGSSFLSGQVTFIGQISGIAIPEYPSSAVNKEYIDIISSNLNAKTGGITYKGWAQLDSAGTIEHGCGAKPSWVNVCPSGTSPFMYSITVDETYITVYHTSPDLETFSWGVVL